MNRTRLIGIVAVVSAITACGPKPPPAVEVRTVRVPVEVPVPCPGTPPVVVAPLERPLPTDAITLAIVLTAKLVEYSGPGKYVDQAEAYVRACPPAP